MGNSYVEKNRQTAVGCRDCVSTDHLYSSLPRAIDLDLELFPSDWMGHTCIMEENYFI